VSVASSHTDRLGKACLMARADDTPDAAYFAVCRTAAGGPLRVQWRGEDGGPTRAIDAGAESAFFLRLDVTPRVNATDVDAYGSRDGVSWARLRQETLGARLVRQGIAASSHGSGPMRFVFGALERDLRRVSSSDLRAERVGECSAGAVSD
jgi:hypothetical protein